MLSASELGLVHLPSLGSGLYETLSTVVVIEARLTAIVRETRQGKGR